MRAERGLKSGQPAGYRGQPPAGGWDMAPSVPQQGSSRRCVFHGDKPMPTRGGGTSTIMILPTIMILLELRFRPAAVMAGLEFPVVVVL